MSKKRKSAFDKVSIKKKDEQVEEPSSHSHQDIDAVDWDAFYKNKPELALATIASCPDRVSPIDKLRFLVSPIGEVRAAAFFGIKNTIIKGKLAEALDPVWRTLLRLTADTRLHETPGGREIHMVFLWLCFKNYFLDNEIDNVVWEQYAVASRGNSQVLPEGLLDWFRKRMPEPCEDYIKDTEIALQQPNADNRFSPDELNFMREQVAAWQKRDLTQRVAEVLEQTKPRVSAL
jgi:hypothetical protein